jgi:nitrate reductase gamma subunit
MVNIRQITILAGGPLVTAAFVVLMAGLAWRTVHLWRLTSLPPTPFKKMPPKAPHLPLPLTRRIKLSVLGINPMTIVVTAVFHLLLCLQPIFLLGHTEMIAMAWGVRWPSFPDTVANILTLIILSCIGFFFFRRILVRRVRKISTARDYLLLGFITGPFATGYLAHHQFFNYEAVILLHMLWGSLMLAVLPFTSFAHMVFLVLFRFRVMSEYSLGKGNRVW